MKSGQTNRDIWGHKTTRDKQIKFCLSRVSGKYEIIFLLILVFVEEMRINCISNGLLGFTKIRQANFAIKGYEMRFCFNV